MVEHRVSFLTHCNKLNAFVFKGAYGIPADLRFSATNAFLLENGWILAFPHVRSVQVFLAMSLSICSFL